MLKKLILEKFLGVGSRTANQKMDLEKNYEISKQKYKDRTTMAKNAKDLAQKSGFGGKIAGTISSKWNTHRANVNLNKANNAATAIKNQRAKDDSKSRIDEIKKKYSDIKDTNKTKNENTNKTKNEKKVIDVKVGQSNKP